MRVFGKMYDKRKQKIADSASVLLEPGETAGPAAICQPERQANLAVLGKKPYKQFLATATEQHFYLFAISPMKNEVFADSQKRLPLAPLDAKMDGRRAVIGEYRLAPLPNEEHLEGLVEFVQQHQACRAGARP